MINKRSLWFLTLFSLILVLSIYYITMPSELLLNDTKNSNEVKSEAKKDSNEQDQATVSVEESDLLVALRVEADSEMLSEIEDLKVVLTNADATTEEKNEAFEKIKNLNNNRSEEEKLETKIKEEFSLNSFIKIEEDQIKVTIESETHDSELANKIMRSIQSNYETSKYISVKFQK